MVVLTITILMLLSFVLTLAVFVPLTMWGFRIKGRPALHPLWNMIGIAVFGVWYFLGAWVFWMVGWL